MSDMRSKFEAKAIEIGFLADQLTRHPSGHVNEDEYENGFVADGWTWFSEGVASVQGEPVARPPDTLSPDYPAHERAAFDKWHMRVAPGFKQYSALNSVELTAAWNAWYARATITAVPQGEQCPSDDPLIKGVRLSDIDPGLAFQFLEIKSSFDAELFSLAWCELKRRAFPQTKDAQ